MMPTVGAVIVTDGNSFWIDGPGVWVDAEDLRPGDMLRTSAGAWIQITAVREYTHHQTVHNLTIAGIHTYHVTAGDTDTLVHNCGGDLGAAVRDEYSRITTPGSDGYLSISQRGPFLREFRIG